MGKRKTKQAGGIVAKQNDVYRRHMRNMFKKQKGGIWGKITRGVLKTSGIAKTRKRKRQKGGSFAETFLEIDKMIKKKL